MSKRVLIVALVGVNLALLAALVICANPPRAAYGQAVAAAGNMLMLTGEIQDGYDALYLVDLPRREMHVFTPEKSRRGRLVYRDTRSLKRDFGLREDAE